MGREAAWSDLINDTIGAMVGIAFFAEGRKSLELYKLRALQVATVILVGWSLLPTGKVIVDDLSSWKQLPLLSGFENRLEVSRWNGSAKRVIDHDIYYSGKSSLRVELTTQRYSGIGLKDFPRNWNNFSAVSLQVYNPDPEPLLLHFRIHDKHHRKNLNAYSDRFNTSFDLVHGWNRLYVPLDKVCEAPKGRLLDLSHVAGMGLFVGKLDRSRTVYIDEVALLP